MEAKTYRITSSLKTFGEASPSPEIAAESLEVLADLLLDELADITQQVGAALTIERVS